MMQGEGERIADDDRFTGGKDARVAVWRPKQFPAQCQPGLPR